jgi:spore germination cell wall hydrolase CwlJ-like protein
MRTHNSYLPKSLRRLLTISFVSLALFFGVTGFIPLQEHTLKKVEKSTYIPPSPAEFARQYNSITSHRLLVEKEEMRCLALNIYWEARSEPLEGQLAVAGVTMNRVAHSKFPDTICDVVQQRRSYRLHRCQFSWWCDGKRDTPHEEIAWRSAQQLARLYLAGIYSDPTHNALWYHADYVKPVWADKLNRSAKFGRHIFYNEEAQQVASLN